MKFACLSDDVDDIVVVVAVVVQQPKTRLISYTCFDRNAIY